MDATVTALHYGMSDAPARIVLTHDLGLSAPLFAEEMPNVPSPELTVEQLLTALKRSGHTRALPSFPPANFVNTTSARLAEGTSRPTQKSGQRCCRQTSRTSTASVTGSLSLDPAFGQGHSGVGGSRVGSSAPINLLLLLLWACVHACSMRCAFAGHARVETTAASRRCSRHHAATVTLRGTSVSG
jgi:hypothetical protein